MALTTLSCASVLACDITSLQQISLIIATKTSSVYNNV